MNSYNPTSLRSTLLAAVCAVIVSGTFLAGALAPASSSSPAAYTIIA
jgi:hypothetical protein